MVSGGANEERAVGVDLLGFGQWEVECVCWVVPLAIRRNHASTCPDRVALSTDGGRLVSTCVDCRIGAWY